jgi:uncharacterized Rossmann fold enzyme
VAPPRPLSYDEQLVWTLGHPDGDRAVLAARILGMRRTREAVPALRDVVARSTDPYLSAEAVVAIVAIEGVELLRGWLEGLASDAPVIVQAAARKALAEARQPGD